ncbi:MAG TPA: hypothetical protein VMS98_20425 [Thermoanaerobaculia bacterium]|nr:hypothetical protein [Thermoanaerobaculia bacterium]
MLGATLIFAGLVCASGMGACKTADLAISATPEQFSVESGGRAAMTVTVENRGGDAVAGTISLYNPGFFVTGRVVSASGSGLTCPAATINDGGLSCSFTGLVAGTSRTLELELAAPVSVSSAVQAEIFTSVRVAEDSADPNQDNNSVMVKANVTPSSRLIDIAVTVPPQPRAFREDDPVTLLVDVANRGAADASGVFVQTNIASSSSAAIRLLGVAGGNWSCVVSGRTIFCAGGALRAGATARMELTIGPREGAGELLWWVRSLADEPHRDTNFTNNIVSYGVSIGSAENYERILVPLIVSAAPGAFGSIWQTELRVFADSDADVRLFPQFYQCPIKCNPAPAFGFPLPKRGMQYVTPEVGTSAAVQGALLYTRRGHGELLHMNLVVRDLSRQATSAGTEIPLVRESDLLTGSLHLMNIRLDSRFRHSLRIYDADAREGAEVKVRLLDTTFGQVLSEVTARFNVDRSVSAGPFVELPARPGYVEIGGLTDNLPELPSVRELRVEIEPLTPDLRYWAFISTTNNETQQVTLITPQ